MTAVLFVSGGATATITTASPAQPVKPQNTQGHPESETECLLEEEEEEEEGEEGAVRGDRASQDDSGISGICDGPGGSLEVLSCRTGPSLTSLPEASCPSPFPPPSPPQTTS